MKGNHTNEGNEIGPKSALRRAGLFTCGSLLAIVILQFLSSYASISKFLSEPMGVLLRTVLISSLVIPYGKILLSHISRNQRLENLMALLSDQVQTRQSLESPKHKKSFLQLFSKISRSADELNQLSSRDSALFILGLQYYFPYISVDDNFDLFDLIRMADRASRDEKYQAILIGQSLSKEFTFESAPFDHGLYLNRKASSFLKVGYSSEHADNMFFERLDAAKDENVYIFSTTSQMSHLSFDILSQYSGAIHELNLFMVSPFISSDEALLELNKEYEVPTFAMPKGQFIDDVNLDLLRRVIRILVGLQNSAEFQQTTGIKVKMLLFKKAYPGVKLRVLKKRAYAQVLPGILKYANNIYRFGIELTDADIVDSFVSEIERLERDPQRIMPLALDPVQLEMCESQALREISWHLFKVGIDAETIESRRPLFRFIIKSDRTDNYLDRVTLFLRRMVQFWANYDFRQADRDTLTVDDVRWNGSNPEGLATTVVPGTGVTAHISTGAVFLRDGKLLLIRKKQAPYRGMWSIVAGHVQAGETAYESLVREVREELNVDVTGAKMIRHYEDIPGDSCRYNLHHHKWFVYLCDSSFADDDITPSADEIEEWRWVPLAELSSIQSYTLAAETILGDLRLL